MAFSGILTAKKRNFIIIITLVSVTLLIMLLFFVQPTAYDIGYISGTQGLEPQFNSVKFHGVWWSNTEQGLSLYTKYGTSDKVYASSHSFGFAMQFDPDEAQKGMPDLCASTQVLTRESDTPVSYAWQVPIGTKTLSNGTIVQVVKQFEMYKYRMDWAMNLWLSGSEWEADGKYEDYPDLYIDGGCYSSSEVWIKLVPKTFCYFTDNPEQVFFAPCYIALKEPVSWIGTDKDGKQTLNDAEIAAINDIIPESTGETTGVYYSRGGADALTESKLLSYQGVALDPSIFRNEYWTKINLIEFQAKSWSSWGITHGWKYPSAYMHFMVDMFVVGQWTVYYKTGEVPQLTPHLPVIEYDILTQFASWLGSPEIQLYLMFMMITLVLILIAWRAPWIFKSLGKKKGGE